MIIHNHSKTTTPKIPLSPPSYTAISTPSSIAVMASLVHRHRRHEPSPSHPSIFHLQRQAMLYPSISSCPSSPMFGRLPSVAVSLLRPSQFEVEKLVNLKKKGF
ncbi:unnamed protein product [Lactuca virosa]|uniref:Uncharacterized protein n=1 Tax=Lactuca virosa TaxID=75947 RepID=A0AAU9LYB9_9ASTR|nr:unnamed protein product [Lactuca virosa]